MPDRAIGRELDRLPPRLGRRELATAPVRLPHLLYYRTWTLQRLYDRLRMPPRLQAVLRKHADNAGAWEELGHAYEALGRFTAAERRTVIGMLARSIDPAADDVRIYPVPGRPAILIIERFPRDI